MDNKETRSQRAQEKPRDEKGHFIHHQDESHQASSSSPVNTLGKVLKDSAHYSKAQDDLLDVHVGNPLRKITLLLEEIKKQKAFSFTLKGSLGILGVGLVLSVFGVFGGSKILCSRGTQSKIGTIRILKTLDVKKSNVAFIGGFIDFFNTAVNNQQLYNRIILIKGLEESVSIPFSQNVNFSQYSEKSVIVTGDFDTCTQELKVTDSSAIEPLD